MANQNELLIKINADAKNATKEFENIRSETEDLEKSLNQVALISGVAFAALSAEIFFSVKAFEEASAASLELSNALQNQGIYTEELVKSYGEYADAVSAATGIDDDALTKAQALAQTYLGQTEITQELTQSIADLGSQMGGDFNGAAEKIARTIGTGTNAFARQGLVISETATEAERYTATLEFVRAKAGGLAAEMDKADGGARRLQTAFGDFQEEIGKRFAPIFATVRNAVASFLNFISSNSALADLTVAFIAAATAVTGIITAAALAIPAFLALKAAVVAFGLSLNVAFVGIPLLIGAAIAAVTLLALNWDKSMAAIQAATRGAIVLISELFSGLGAIITGAIAGNPAKIKEGLNQITGAVAKTREEIKTVYEGIRADQVEAAAVQDADKKAQADKAAQVEREHQANLRAIRKAELEILQLQNENASQEYIDLKQKEIETIKQLDAQKGAEEQAALQERYEILKELQNQQFEEDQQRALEFAEIKAASEAELVARGIETESAIRETKLAQIKAGLLTEADAERQIQEQILKTRIEARNKELIDRKKYGDTIAAINKVLGSEEVQGAKTAANELVGLQESKSKELKAIGKAAAVAQITISTAESAMNIYKGFSTIPIIGPALGIAGAAAAVIFGGERIAKVTSAQDGGLIEGGIPGRDSVPALLEPGELVVPRRNFEDVVGAVGGQGGGIGNEEILNTLQSIDNKISTPQSTTIIGDVLTDDSYVDALVKKISDAVEFRNARIFGVTS